MTVDELIKRLQALSAVGHGSAEILINDSSHGLTQTVGNVYPGYDAVNCGIVIE